MTICSNMSYGVYYSTTAWYWRLAFTRLWMFKCSLTLNKYSSRMLCETKKRRKQRILMVVSEGSATASAGRSWPLAASPTMCGNSMPYASSLFCFVRRFTPALKPRTKAPSTTKLFWCLRVAAAARLRPAFCGRGRRMCWSSAGGKAQERNRSSGACMRSAACVRGGGAERKEVCVGEV